MKPVPALGLRGRLILLLLAAFAVIFAMIVQHTVDHGAEKTANTTTYLLHKVQLIAARQQQTTARADAILNDLMTHAELRPAGSTLGVRQDAFTENCMQFLAARAEKEPAYINISKVLPNGDVACAAAPRTDDRVNFADRTWFQSALKSEDMVVSDVLVGRIVGKPIVVFAKAMRDATGKVLSVFSLSLDLGWLQHELTKGDLPEGARLVVVDAKGAVVAHHPDPEGHTGRNIAQQPLFQAIVAHGVQGTIEEKGLDGARRIVAFAPLLNTVSGPMYLWLSLPKAVVTAPAQRELAVSLAIASMVLLLVIVLVSWGGYKLLIWPLRRLIQAVARFGTGDLAVRTGLPHTDDDIGRLAHAFDAMAGSVQTGEIKLARANKALRVLSAGNRAMLRAGDEQDLLEQMCRAIVEAGGYRIAWVGFAEHDQARSVRPAAVWGDALEARDFLAGLKITWDETESGRGPTGAAIRRGIPIATNDVLTDPDYAPWRERAQRYGYAASLALPLRIDSRVIGALNIYAAEPDAFGDDVVELLSEAADDLAFGIAVQRGQAAHGRTRAALQTAEERFRAVAEASLDALFILKPVRGDGGGILDFEFTDLNPSAEQMLDMTREQVVGRKLCELLPINRTGGFFDKYVAVATTGEPLEEEFPIDTPQIQAKWLRHQVVRVGDGIAISSRDVTAWKMASAEIRRQGRLRTMILKSAGEGIFGLDLEGCTTFANPAAVAMLQRTEEELVGKPAHAMHHHTKVDGTPYPPEECPIYAAYRDGEVRRVEGEVFWRKDGTRFPVEYVSTPIHDDQGNLDGAVVSFTDITERKQTEQVLRDSEERFRVTMENFRDGFIVIDGEDERIVLWNPAAAAMFGYGKEEAIGQPMHQLIVPTRFHDAVHAGLANFTRTGEGAAVGRTTELVALRRDGVEFPVEMSLSAMQLGGRWHAAGLVRDITERKAAEKALARAVRTLETLSEVNQVLVRASDEAQLLQEVCRGIVEKGGYRMAWVAFADDNPEKTITPKAWAGVEEGYLAQLNLTWADTERGQGPTSRAIRSSEAQVSHDIRSDPGFDLWRELVEAHGYAANFSYPLAVAGKVIGALGIYAAEPDAFDENELALLTELGGDLAFGIETLRTRAERDRIAYAHVHHAEILQKSLEQSIQAIADTVEARDPYTAGHQRRVGELAVAIAREMGLPEEKIHGIDLAATIHDLGKIHIPAEILSKPGKLSDIEFMFIKTHPQAGYEILKDIAFPWPIADIVRQHHEKLDGSGYPQGLSGGQILLESRIMTVADVVEAMSSHRPYRAALGIEVSLKEIESGRGSAYDAQVADACLKLFREGRFAFQA